MAWGSTGPTYQPQPDRLDPARPECSSDPDHSRRGRRQKGLRTDNQGDAQTTRTDTHPLSTEDLATRGESHSQGNLSNTSLLTAEVYKVNFVFPNGDKYDGDCTRTSSGIFERNGIGIHTTPNGIIYTGSWKDDKISEILKVSQGPLLLSPWTSWIFKCPRSRTSDLGFPER
ncbi:Morn Repeat-Containing Protein 1 [Manis pentadactyla]|nr:Morn Repeat-Containing Protein 1 [Manis pentadactyla]